MTNMKDVNAEKSLVDCNPRDDSNSVNIDTVPKECGDTCFPSQKRVPMSPPKDWNRRKTFKKLGIGQHRLCDPIATGQIINDLDIPNREVIYRYSRAIRATDEAMLDVFRNVQVIDEEGKAHIVPIIWASQEKAVEAILADNVRKDNSLVVDRIRLPTMSIWNGGFTPDNTRFTYQKNYSLLQWLDPQGVAGFTKQEKFEKDTFFGVTRGIPINVSYTLYIWTLFEEDMNQIMEQVFLKFSPIATLQVKGVYWEVIVTLDGTQNNIDLEPGDAKIRVLKYQVNMTAKTYIPQPIYRLKKLPEKICEYQKPGKGDTETSDDDNDPNENNDDPLLSMTEEEVKNAIEEVRQNIKELEEMMKP